jgi:phage shock protein PspC (stress-responsive transcriptional regulator)
MRSLGIQRQPGWIGGVCAGIASRLGIDPLIVRGIAVVVAVLGGPALLLYAAAWLLLPDNRDLIHLEELIRGKLSSAIAGIGVFVLFSLLPVTQGFWSMGSYYWGAPEWPQSVGRALWTLIVIGLIVWLVVWIARRSSTVTPAPGVPAAAATATSTSTGAADDSPAPDASPVPDAAATVSTIALVAEPDAAPVTPTVEPALTQSAPPPPEGAPAEDFTAWREQQEAWKAESEAFRQAEAATTAAIAAQVLAELQEKNRIAAAERVEARRLRKLANPRLSAAWVFVVLGAALVASGVGALVASVSPDPSMTIVTTGLALATLVVGVGIVIAGLARRRSGFLSAVAIILIVLLVPLSFVPGERELVLSPNYGLTTGEYSQVAGQASIFVYDERTGVIDLWQGLGSVSIGIDKGQGAHLEVVQQNGSFEEMQHGIADDGSTVLGSWYVEPQLDADGRNTWTTDLGTITPTSPTIRITQGSGTVSVYYADPDDSPLYDDEDTE